MLKLSQTLTVKIVNGPLESDFFHLVTTMEAKTKAFFIVLPCCGEMDFAGVCLGSFVRLYPAIRRSFGIVDIHIWSIVKLCHAG